MGELFEPSSGTTDMAEECALVVNPNNIGHQAEIHEMQFYIESFTDKSLYAGNLVLQGS